ncbi:hypothetical protein [Sphingomonas sp. MA1305]|uniref:hypothetical protein n=1 Tax=Sphingomonas sp. MA1305 TaxID=2479204 RepID=UPI0018DF50A0|nr:hypothetical protein [Sphingomonas sp. MA1305]
MTIAAPYSLEKFDEWAEDTFQQSGSGTGAAINPPRRDRRGWDFLVEWDVPSVPNAPLDRQLTARTARIQVKSTISDHRKPAGRVTLSNALRFAESVDPCFIVLYALDKGGQTVSVYGRHFDDQLVERTLKRAREADRDGLEPHRIELVIPMVPDDCHTDDLIPWIIRTCVDEPAVYSRNKLRVHETVGYDQGSLVGSIKFPSAHAEAFVEHAVGLNPTFNPSWVELKEARFGIPARMPIVAGEPAHFSMRVNPRKSALKFTSGDGRTIVMNGETRWFKMPGSFGSPSLVGSYTSSHVTGRMYDSGLFKMNYSLSAPEVGEIRSILDIVDLILLLQQDSLRIVLTVDDSDWDTGSFNIDRASVDVEFLTWCSEVLKALMICCRRSDKPLVSIGQLAECGASIEHFAKCVTPGEATLRLEGPDNQPVRGELTQLLGYAYAQVGDSTFAAFYRQSITSYSASESERVAVFGSPEIIDRWAKKGALSQHTRAIRRRFKQLLERAPTGTVYVDEGDMITGTQQARTFQAKF